MDVFVLQIEKGLNFPCQPNYFEDTIVPATLIHMECNHRATQLAKTQDPGGFVYCSKKARAKQKAAGSSNSPVPHGSDLTFKYETTRQKNIDPDDDF